MKRNIFVIFLASALLFACSKDADLNSDSNESSAIVGEWQATELQIDDATASDNAKFGKQILDFLTANDCVILTFIFNADLTATAINSANYLQINSTATGLDVPCPSQSDSESSTYTFNGSVLSTVDTDGMTVNIDATVNGNTLTLDAADLNIPNFNDSGQLVFTKK